MLTQEQKDERRARLLEAASALLCGADGQRLQMVNLNKAIFYLDLVCLRDLGSPITNTTFVALKQGPVVAHYEKRLVLPLLESGIAVGEPEGQSKPIKLISPLFPMKYVTPQIQQLAENVGGWISRKTATEVSHYSHKNLGWKRAYRNGLGAHAKPQPIDLSIAMQQIVDVDPWLLEPLGEESLAAVAAADQGGGADW